MKDVEAQLELSKTETVADMLKHANEELSGGSPSMTIAIPSSSSLSSPASCLAFLSPEA